MSGIKIFAGEKSQYLGKEITKEFGTTLGEVKLSKFSDG